MGRGGCQAIDKPSVCSPIWCRLIAILANMLTDRGKFDEAESPIVSPPLRLKPD